jgi:hypothetical protein
MLQSFERQVVEITRSFAVLCLLPSQSACPAKPLADGLSVGWGDAHRLLPLHNQPIQLEELANNRLSLHHTPNQQSPTPSTFNTPYATPSIPPVNPPTLPTPSTSSPPFPSAPTPNSSTLIKAPNLPSSSATPSIPSVSAPEPPSPPNLYHDFP